MKCSALVLACTAPLFGEPFPEPIDSETVEGSPLAPAKAAASFQVPGGFEVHVFAAEPEIRNPIAVSWDGSGRLWVAENFTFERLGANFDPRHRDRVVIFKDSDHDHRADERVVFHDRLQNLTSIEWAPDGLWVMCPPRLLFIPDADRDDVPDGPARVALDGFTVPEANHHNFANGLRWGPDGWLYGRCGASAPGEVGAPGTPEKQRIPLRGGIWRYHPQSRVYETLNSGLTNPWGHDWDRHGELFFVNTVNGHLWHHITGAHYVRGTSIDPNPWTYELIDTHADHWHFDTTGSWSQSRDGAANDFGGGHSHIGAMIYQADHWPREYRNHLFTLNQHGRRANQEILERRGSGYVARHGEDLLVSGDPFFRGIDLTTGPDGGVYVIDWSDTGECHENTGVHRNSGRIFKVTHREAPQRESTVSGGDPTPGDVIAGHSGANAWHSRMSRLRGDRDPQVLRWFEDSLAGTKAGERTTALRLCSLWSLHRVDAIGRDDLVGLLDDPDEHVRVWAIRLLTDRFPLDTVLSERPPRPEASDQARELLPRFIELATDDPSPMVRLSLASVLQRLPVDLRSRLAIPLVRHAEDATDHNIPLMIWFGLIPLGREDASVLAAVAAESEIPTIREFTARFLAAEHAATALDLLLAKTAKAGVAAKADILRGLATGFVARQSAPEPRSWKRFTESLAGSDAAAVRQDLDHLNALFGDGRNLADIRRLVLDPGAPLDTRKAALRTLVQKNPDDLQDLCLQVLNVRFLNTVALDGLARSDDPETGRRIILRYQNFHPGDRARVIEVMVSRAPFAHALLDRIAAGKLPRTTLTPFHARQVLKLGDPGLDAKLVRHWGKVTEVAAGQQALIEQYRRELTPAALAAADLPNGRVLYEATCAGCHPLYGRGRAIGPDLTGGGRGDLDYLLENIVTPSAVVSKDQQVTVLTLEDGRTLSGIVRRRQRQSLEIQTLTTIETIALSAIESETPLSDSFMPAGLLSTLEPGQRRDLVAYLMHPHQVPLPEE
ncbi:PVC-type heme-binding CxxCH protein [Haloferula sp. A504]|uniref:PVC-type heme-binding CxxCH protein n=1 Tax=Haloferula sp. A504 TaxID=3373601 RepID=UPI0031C076DD|nr:c-type cytochrome [Verrucomicrobiaceae bacterium E54]